MRLTSRFVSALLAGLLSGLPAVGTWCLLTCVPAASGVAEAATSCHEVTTTAESPAEAARLGAADCADHDRLAGLPPATFGRVEGLAPAPDATALVASAADVPQARPAAFAPRRPPDSVRPSVLRI